MNVISLTAKNTYILLFAVLANLQVFSQGVIIPPIEIEIKTDAEGDQCIRMGNEMNTATIAYEHHVPEGFEFFFPTGLIESHNFIGIKVSDQIDEDAVFIMNNGAMIIGTTDPCLKIFDDNVDLYVESEAINENGSGFWTTTSDQRLKTNIKSLSANINDFKKLNFYNFEYKKSGIQRNGIMAQEMQKVLPQSVGSFWEPDGTEYLTFNPNDLFYWGLSVTQELVKNNEILMQENEDLKSEVETLKEQMQMVFGLLEQENNSGENIEGLLNLNNAKLFQNRPNPLHESTKIEYILPNDFRQAYISIHSLNGQLIANVELHDEGDVKGQIQFDPAEYQLRAGTYYYTLFVDGAKIDSKKMVFIE